MCKTPFRSASRTLPVFAVAACAAAFTPAAAAEPRKNAPGAEYGIEANGRVVPAQKIPHRLPPPVQMAFESPAETASACPPQAELAPAEAESLVRRIAESEKFYPEFVVAVARRESQFRIDAISAKGAYGLMQLMPETAKRFQADPCIPEQNVRGGIHYLRHLWERWRNPFYILAAYNAGEEAVIQNRGVPPYPETAAFIAAVISDFYGYPGIEAPARDSEALPHQPPAVRASLPGRQTRSAGSGARRTGNQPDWLVMHLE